MNEYELHKKLGYRVSRLSRIMQARLEERLAKHQLTRLTWCVLSGIGEEDVRSPSELADYVGVTRPAMSRLLRELEGRELVRRNNGHGRDGRAVQIELTKKGREVTTASRVCADAINSRFTSKLSSEQLDMVLEALETLAADEGEELTNF